MPTRFQKEIIIQDKIVQRYFTQSHSLRFENDILYAL